MSFIEDNDLQANYVIGISERFKTAQEYTNIELAELLIEEQRYIDTKFKKRVTDIANIIIKMEPITERQRNVLEKAYVYNFDIDRDNYRS